MTIPGETKLLAGTRPIYVKEWRTLVQVEDRFANKLTDLLAALRRPISAATKSAPATPTAEKSDGECAPPSGAMRQSAGADTMSAEPVAWQWRSKAGFWNQVYSPIPDFKSLHERELKIGEIEIRPVYASPPMSVGDMARVRAETIEECAKVVEGFNNRMFETVDQRMKAIAAEIRTIASGTATK